MKTLALCAALLFATSCATAPAAVDGPLEFRKVAEGGFAASPQGPRAVAVSDLAGYRRTWDTLVAEHQPPAIDFGRESAVFLFAGERRTGGYTIEVKGVRMEGETLVVDAVVHRPDPAALVLQVLTKPYVVLAVSTNAFRGVRWNPGPDQP